MNYVPCPGCGRGFKGERGLKAHQSQRFVSMACKPAPKPTEWVACPACEDGFVADGSECPACVGKGLILVEKKEAES